MAKIPFRASSRKSDKDPGKGDEKDGNGEKERKEKPKGKGGKSLKKSKRVSDDESVDSYPSQIGFSDTSNNKQPAGQSSTGWPRRDSKSNSGGSGVSSRYSMDPGKRQQDIDKKNASSKHNLGVFYYKQKQDFDKAKDYLDVALQARINLYGKKDGRVLETQLALVDVLIGQSKKPEGIELLKKTHLTLKKLRQQPKGKDSPSKSLGSDSPGTNSDQLADSIQPIDLDTIYEKSTAKMKALGVTSTKPLPKAPPESSTPDSSYGPPHKNLGKGLAFLEKMKTDDLTQEEIRLGVLGLNDEIPDNEIYVDDPSDKRFEEILIAHAVLAVRKEPKEEEKKVEGPFDHDNDDSSYVDSEDEREREEERKRKEKEEQTITDIRSGHGMYRNGEIVNAKEYYHQNVDAWIDVLGHDNPSIISVKEDLGDIEYSFGNYAMAKEHFEDATKAQQKVGENNDCVRLLQKLGVTRAKLSEKESAYDAFDKAYDMHERILEKDSADNTTNKDEASFQKGTILFLKGDYQKAKEPLVDVLRRTTHLGDKQNPLLLNMIGMIIFTESRYDEARVNFEKAHRAAESNENISPKDRSNILHNLGNVYIHTHQFEKAKDHLDGALDELDKCDLSDFEKESEKVRILTKIGHAHFYLSNFDDAFDCYSEAFSTDLRLYNDEKRDTVLNLSRYIGLTRSLQGRYDDALYVFEGVLYSQKRDNWPDNILCGKTLLDMSEIYFVCGSSKLSEKMQLQHARICCERASEIFTTNKLSSDHPYMKQACILQKLLDA